MDEQQLNEQEQVRLFDTLYPNGFAGSDVMSELAPNGWASSPLAACFHPSVEQVWHEAVAMQRNVESLVRKGAPPRPDPTLEEIRRTYATTPIEPEREACELVAACVWDIFSDNHDVISADGRRVRSREFPRDGRLHRRLPECETGFQPLRLHGLLHGHHLVARPRPPVGRVRNGFQPLEARGMRLALPFPAPRTARSAATAGRASTAGRLPRMGRVLPIGIA